VPQQECGQRHEAQSHSLAGVAHRFDGVHNVNAIFGSAVTANLMSAMNGWAANWKMFCSANGIPNIVAPHADQINLAARAAAWDDAVGVALDNNQGPLKGQTANFLMDAAEGIVGYSMSLVGQPAHQPFKAKYERTT
jgi:hypothetical protein